MKSLYSSPLRVYICLGLLALFGIFSGLNLPVSMFPNSTKPDVMVRVPYGSFTAEEFAKVYGSLIESRLRSLSDKDLKIKTITTNYNSSRVDFLVSFDWGVDQKRAVKEVETSIYGLSAQFPREIRDRLQVNSWSENSGFLAVSIYSESRGLDELYELIEPTLTPRLAQIPNTEGATLWNPVQKEVQVELIPETMAALQVLPRDVSEAIANATSALNGGSLTVNTSNLRIQMPRPAVGLDELRRIPLISRTGRAVHLQDVARVELKPSAQNSNSFKTSGSPSLLLFASPSAGGNIKEMAESILKVMEDLKPSWPKDVQMRVLVDPSEFIRNSISNVVHEVALSAFLAVLILFLFVGSFRNVATAAIEIPLSIILAFILMRMTGININLISLGGLALSSGMNVDASVVVMENIFRHFEMHKGPLTYNQRLAILCEAVGEVRLPVIASTIASLVVFLPLAFTSQLSNAILGDLAKTVVFSHGFSAIVALILVPTIRMQLMSNNEKPAHSPIEGFLNRLENAYVRSLDIFLNSRLLQIGTYTSVVVILAALFVLVLPRLQKEIIGMPDTDWIFMSMRTQGNTRIQQMEEQAAEAEAKLLKKYGHDISYTFTQIQGSNNASVMARLKNKKQMTVLWKAIQADYPNSPFISYFVMPWNPSELPIPDPPHFQASVRGGTPRSRLELAHQIDELLQEKKFFSRVRQNPGFEKAQDLVIKPHLDQWAPLMASGVSLLPSDLTDISRIATQGRPTDRWVLGNQVYDVVLYYPKDTISTLEDLAAFPIGVKNKIIPLKALAQVTTQEGDPARYRKDQQDVVEIYGRHDKGEESKSEATAIKAAAAIRDWQSQNQGKMGNMSIQIDDAQYELNDALNQLGIAIALSILLIFVTMVIQLGDLMSSVLVLVAIPLGFIGVLASLYLFNSTLSLNSALGVILLNGVAVANSIILVDFFNKLMRTGMAVHKAALKAAQARLRPILMTSLTTTIGMLPIALGLGEGGRVLQPLGIAVSGGLWISMIFTLYLVPALQVTYWKWKGQPSNGIGITPSRELSL